MLNVNVRGLCRPAHGINPVSYNILRGRSGAVYRGISIMDQIPSGWEMVRYRQESPDVSVH